jgi:hypothetical protein
LPLGTRTQARGLDSALGELDRPAAREAAIKDPIGYAQVAATAGLGKAILASFDADLAKQEAAEKLKAAEKRKDPPPTG